MRNCKWGRAQTRCRSLRGSRNNSTRRGGGRGRWQRGRGMQSHSLQPPHLSCAFCCGGKMDMKRAKSPQASAGTIPAFLTEAFTNQHPSREAAAASELSLHQHALLHTGHCPDTDPVQVGNGCCTNAVSKCPVKGSIAFALASQMCLSPVPRAEMLHRSADTCVNVGHAGLQCPVRRH